MRIDFNRVNRFVALIVLCLLLIHYVPARTSAASQPAQQIVVNAEEYINAAVKVNRFSGSILVARDGKPLISKGATDIKWDKLNEALSFEGATVPA